MAQHSGEIMRVNPIVAKVIEGGLAISLAATGAIAVKSAIESGSVDKLNKLISNILPPSNGQNEPNTSILASGSREDGPGTPEVTLTQTIESSPTVMPTVVPTEFPTQTSTLLPTTKPTEMQLPTHLAPIATALPSLAPTQKDIRLTPEKTVQGGEVNHTKWEYTINGKALRLLQVTEHDSGYTMTSALIDGKNYYPNFSYSMSGPRTGYKYMDFAWESEEVNTKSFEKSSNALSYPFRLILKDGTVLDNGNVPNRIMGIQTFVTPEGSPKGIFRVVFTIRKEQEIEEVLFSPNSMNSLQKIFDAGK